MILWRRVRGKTGVGMGGPCGRLVCAHVLARFVLEDADGKLVVLVITRAFFICLERLCCGKAPVFVRVSRRGEVGKGRHPWSFSLRLKAEAMTITTARFGNSNHKPPVCATHSCIIPRATR